MWVAYQLSVLQLIPKDPHFNAPQHSNCYVAHLCLRLCHMKRKYAGLKYGALIHVHWARYCKPIQSKQSSSNKRAVCSKRYQQNIAHCSSKRQAQQRPSSRSHSTLPLTAAGGCLLSAASSVTAPGSSSWAGKPRWPCSRLSCPHTPAPMAVPMVGARQQPSNRLRWRYRLPRSCQPDRHRRPVSPACTFTTASLCLRSSDFRNSAPSPGSSRSRPWCHRPWWMAHRLCSSESLW